MLATPRISSRAPRSSLFPLSMRSCEDSFTTVARPVDCPHRSGHGPELSDVKSRAGRRGVTLPAPLIEALRVQRIVQLEERLAAGSAWWREPPAPKGHELGPHLPSA